MDATMRDCFVASVRMTTHRLATELTQRAGCRTGGDAAGGAMVAGTMDGGCEATGATFGVATNESDARRPGASVVVGAAGVAESGAAWGTTVAAAAAGDTVVAMVSGARAAGADVAIVFTGALGADLAALSRRIHAVATIPINAAMPAPRQMSGARGACSGFVPHHRHEPTPSG